MVKCEINGENYESIEDLHKFLRKFKIKQSDYYHQYFPRKDLMTNELIPFDNYDQYFSQEFINKINLRKWLKENEKDGKEWAIKWLKNRKKEKQLIYSPSQVELRSLFCPSMKYYDSLGGYYKICEELGFKNRYNNDKLKFNSILDKSIIIDSREQKPINLSNYKTTISALKVGDYSLKNNDLNIYIERKSLSDMCGTFSKGLERFNKELERAKESDSYIITMVENNIADALGFNFLPQTRWVKAQPQFIFKNLRDLLVKYSLNFQILFVDGRKDFSNKLIKIFELGNQVKTVDLQYRLELGEL